MVVVAAMGSRISVIAARTMSVVVECSVTHPEVARLTLRAFLGGT
jgi:hypothetical protein